MKGRFFRKKSLPQILPTNNVKVTGFYGYKDGNPEHHFIIQVLYDDQVTASMVINPDRTPTEDEIKRLQKYEAMIGENRDIVFGGEVLISDTGREQHFLQFGRRCGFRSAIDGVSSMYAFFPIKDNQEVVCKLIRFLLTR